MSVAVEQVVDEIDVDAIEDLVHDFQSLSDYDRRQMNEATVRQQYINPLLRALGWDTETDQVLPEQRTLTGDADYALSLHGREQFFIEAKPFSESLDGTRRVRGEEQSYVEQAIDYAWHQACDWAVLTNFKELRLYFTHVSKDDLNSEGLIFSLSADEYVTDDGLEQLAQLSKPAVQNGSLEAMESARERASVSEEILNVLSDARVNLTVDVYESHDDMEMNELREGVQRIIDRLVVMRVAEDRSVIPRDSLLNMMESWSDTTINPDVRTLVRDLKNAFRDFDSVYNSELFAEHECENYEITNEVLEEIIEDLYGYQFHLIDADLLGTIYEDYLGHAIQDKEDDAELELVSQADHRVDEGIFYTPIPVVEYIVESTLGEKLDQILDDARAELESDDPDIEAAREEFDRIEETRFLDVTCGSGSFLIKAYDLFVDAYEEYREMARGVNQDGSVQSYTAAQTIPSDYKKQILQNNIFGVDRDYQATEIATVNLLLKALKRDEKLPAILDENINSGNSLLNGSAQEVAEVLDISEEEANELGAFDWESVYADVFDDGGFDVIAGNPPWGADMDEYEAWLEDDEFGYELASGHYNSYEVMIELGEDLLAEGGTLGFIIPDTIFNDDYVDLREWLVTNHQLDQIHKLGEGVFGEDVFAATAILQYTVAEASDDQMVDASLLMKEDREKMLGTGGEALGSLIEAKRNPTRLARYRNDEDFTMDVWAGEPDHEIMEIMEENTVPWGEVIDNGRGDETGRDGKVMKCPYCLEWDTYPRKRAESKGGGYYSKTCGNSECGEEYKLEEAADTAQIVSDDPSGERDTPIYYGEHVNRYRITGNGFMNDDIDGPWLKDDQRFEPPKLLIRRTGVGFFTTIDYSEARALKANLVFRLLEERDEPFDQYDLEYFLGFLNTRVMLYYYAKTQGVVEWQSFPRHTQTFIMSLPIPEVDFDDEEELETYEEFVGLVREAVETDGKIDDELDWDIERAALDLYGIPNDSRPRIWNELKELQRLRIVRELFPDETDETAD